MRGVSVVCVSLLRIYGFVCDTFRLFDVPVFDWIVTCDPVFSTTLYGTGLKCVENLSCFLCCKKNFISNCDTAFFCMSVRVCVLLS